MARIESKQRVSPRSLASLAAGIEAHEVLWLQRLRRSALGRFEALGLPTTRDEEWRQTTVAALGEMRLTRPQAVTLSRADLEPLSAAGLDCPRVVVVNGRFDAALSDVDDLPSGLRVEGLGSALRSHPETLEASLGRVAPFEDRAFSALNTAAFEDGTVVSIAPRAVAESPIHVLHVAVAAGLSPAIHPRTLVVAGTGSQATVIETYVSLDGDLHVTNAVTEIVVGEDAILDHARVQWENERAYHFGAVQARQARASGYTNHNVSFGSALARNDIASLLEGEGAEATLNGLYLATGRRHTDNHTVLEHAAPHCPSRELYKGILSDRAHVVFNGRIIVRPGAQRTDAKQSNNTLLLSNDALIHTRPQLEIYADDVKCTHGATIGHLDDDALFYLRTRGIELDEARALLIRGFVGDIVERIAHAPLASRLAERIVAVTAHRAAAGGDA
jgi:Fe-S cluster assembly protein SufD